MACRPASPWHCIFKRATQLSLIFNPGNWANPADPVIVDKESQPEIYAWATAAFGAIDARDQLPEDQQRAAYYQGEQHIRDVLWASLDIARRTFDGRWPPISFVTGGDDEIQNIVPYMVARGILPEHQR